ncbi:MAG: response regulator [Deltaproteobacteria bacterium]|nr:MAG: response regulator [Deltaproteobacteria bacterium]
MNLFDKLRPMRLFLVDDDQWIRDSLSTFFELEGCHLMAFETAEEALAALKENPDIFIVDYKLPGMDGLEFFKRIQTSHPHAGKILITAYLNNGVLSKAVSMGIEDFIQKPFTTKTIEESLLRIIEEKKQNNGSPMLPGLSAEGKDL